MGDNVFKDCTDLASVTIGDRVPSIGKWAFYGCSSLTTVNIGYSVKTINNRAFSNCIALTSITIPNGVTTIGGNAFNGCSALTSITISNKVTTIDDGAFKGCSRLASLTIGNTVKTIGGMAFSDCSSLASVTIPNSVTSIGNQAFNECSGLTTVTIGKGVTTIGIKAFYNCSSLTSITIGRSVTSIGYQAFEGCNEITNVRFACEYVDNWFSGYNKINEIVFGNNVKEIGANAFYGCNGLTSLKIGNGVREIGEKAFASCPELTDVHCYRDNPPRASKNAFEDSYIEYATLYVPESSIHSYNYPQPWIWFGNIKAMENESNLFKLTYMIDDGVYKSYEIEEGEIIKIEPAPVKEGYTFSGWSEIPETMPAHDVTVTGIFTINRYKFVYTVDGQEYKSFEYDYGANITPEPAPTKEGYTFSGWSEIPETMPAHDVTVTGTFSINSYKLTYMIDDLVYKETMYEYGATITPEPKPVGDYDTFEWIDLPEKMPAHDVVVYANYTSGINGVLMTPQRNKCIFSPSGKRLNKLQKGLNIVVLDDGSVKKVVVK